MAGRIIKDTFRGKLMRGVSAAAIAAVVPGGIAIALFAATLRASRDK